MKKTILSIAIVAIAMVVRAQDTLRVEAIDPIEVVATRANFQTPVAHTDLDKGTIAAANFGKDIPFLLTLTPSVVATSDAGAGIGYTGVRIRGTDETRINVTANGVPLNDPESHRLYWVNLPDFAASIQDIQIQRGVGTSTNGSGAFGGSINILSEALATNGGGEIGLSGGSFGTMREMVKVNSGLLGDRWALSLRGSNINSDGYIARASAAMQSYFAQLGYYGKRTTMKWLAFGGREHTYHAWDGISAEQMKKDRRYNPCGEMIVKNSLGKDSLAGFYPNQMDVYQQLHYQFIVNHQFTDRLAANLTLHHTDGGGYYEQYKNKRTLEEYGLLPTPNAKSNLVRKKNMTNTFDGFVASLTYNTERLSAAAGMAFNDYLGDHWGNVIWVRDYVGLTPNHEYYRNRTDKWEANAYARAQYKATKWMSLYGDMQYRHISHYIAGANDVWDWMAGSMQALTVNRQYDFFNPKAGLTFTINPLSTAYISVAVAHKEPTRNNFTDATPNDPTPLPERLTDYEAGYNFRLGKVFSASVNLYYMEYKNQLILTGKNNEIGEPMAANVPQSYRTGVELAIGGIIVNGLRLDVNATFSRNRILNYTEYMDDYDADWNSLYTQTAHYVGATTISYSPSVIAGGLLSYQWRGLMAALHVQFVGSQYTSNSEQPDLRLPSYFVANLRLKYDLGKIAFGVELNNLFNAMYCSNGWGSSAMVGGVRNNSMGYFPQAGFNALASINFKF